MSSPLISIVLPTYRVESYVSRCLESCLVQTVSGFELIFVDDCGGDESIKIVESYAKGDDRIRIVRNEQNQGTFVSRRNGVLAARGDYVFFLDPDDELSPLAIEKILAATSVGMPDIVITGVRVLPEKWFARGVDLPRDSVYPDVMKALFLDVSHPFWGTPGKVYSRRLAESAFDKLSFIEGRLVFSEDVLFYFVCAAMARKAMVVQDGLYCYHKNATSITNSLSQSRLRLISGQIEQVMGYIRFVSRDPGLCQSGMAESVAKVCRLLEADKSRMARHSLDELTGRSLYVQNMLRCCRLDFNFRVLVRLFLYVATLGRVAL